MKVKYIGFGGYAEYPCYEDENGKIYFDLNDGKNGLNLYTGAYRHPEDGDICGEPCSHVVEKVECDEPFERHPREFAYKMLARLQMDCNYFLGNGYEGNLYYKNVEHHCDEMEKLWNSFSAEDKPEWLTLEQIKEYRIRMQEKRRRNNNMEEKVTKDKVNYGIVLLEREGTSGLTKNDITLLCDMILEGDTEAYPIELEARNVESAAMGFITKEAADNLDYDYEESGLHDFIALILDDMCNEKADHHYVFRGIDIYLSR